MDMYSLQARYRMTARLAKHRLVNFRINPKTAIFDMSVEIEHLVRPMHPYVPAQHKYQIVMDHMVHSLDNRALQCNLSTSDTFSVVGTVRAIKGCLDVGSSN